MTALIGRITEPVMTNRAMIVVAAISRMAQGRCAAEAGLLIDEAGGEAADLVGYGAGVARMSSTSVWPTSERPPSSA